MRIEHWWYTLPLRVKSLFRRSRVELELDEELRFHLEQRIEEGIAAGLSPEDARLQALRAMGGLEQRKEQIRDTRHIHWLTDFFDDLRYAIRSLRRTPGLAAFVVITIALGVGMTSTPFSMLDVLIFRPYPVPRPSEVVTLVSTSRENRFDGFSYREYLDIRDQSRSYKGVIANGGLTGVGFSTTPGVSPRVAGAMTVSGNYFRALDVAPQLGRSFRDDEDAVPGRDPVVVLGSDFWERELARDPGAVGRTLRLNGVDFTVIGVAPESFPGMQIFGRPDFYVPLAMAKVISTSAQGDFFADRDDRVLSVKGRLNQDTTLGEARSELSLVARNLERAYPKSNRDRGAEVRTQFEMRTREDDVNWKFGVIFTILALAVLLVACTNVAGLLLSRASTRTREIAIRLALGSGRFRLIRMLLTESLLLAFLGGLGGIAVGYAGLEFIGAFRIPTELPVTIPFQMNGRVLMASLVLCVLCALVCGLAPALQSTQTNLVNGLKSSGAETQTRKRLSGRSALVVAQIATSLMLLAASLQMFRSFQHSLFDELGFAKDHLLMVRLDPRLVQFDETQTRHFYEVLTERVQGLPGVVSVTFTQNPPLALSAFADLAFVPDAFQLPRDRENFTSAMDTVDEEFFPTMRIPILSGRGFLSSDSAASPPVAVVNEQFAKHYWPGSDAVGKRIRLGSSTGVPVEIVGVVPTTKVRSTSEKPTDFVYMPLAQHPVARMVLLVRSAGDPLQLVEPVKEIVGQLAPNLPLLETRDYEDFYRYHAVEGPRVAIELAAIMGVVALLLAIAGLYGLVAYNVSRRTQEIGIRMAIGAGPSDVLRLVLRKGLALVGTGTAIGLAMGMAIERLMNSMVFGTGRVDIAAYLVVVPTLFLVTILAAWVPARRASRIPPTQALRYE